MLKDNALDLAIDQLFSLEKEIRDTLGTDPVESFVDFRDHYFSIIEDNDVVFSLFPELVKYKSDIISADNIVRRGNFVIIEILNTSDSAYVFLASKEIKNEV